MKFDVLNTVTHPASLVLETMIDRMEAIVPFLDDVESIETLQREDLDGGRIRIVRRWQGSPSAAPAVLAPLLSREMFAWNDSAVWTPSQHKVEWTHQAAMPSIAALYECTGTNTFTPDPASPEGATRVHVCGNLTVRPDRFPGVPWLVGRTLAPQIERFVVGLIKPNLESLAAGLQKYLDGVPR